MRVRACAIVSDTKTIRHIRPVFACDSSQPIITLTAGNSPYSTCHFAKELTQLASRAKTKMHSKFMNDCAKCLSKMYVNCRD